MASLVVLANTGGTQNVQDYEAGSFATIQANASGNSNEAGVQARTGIDGSYFVKRGFITFDTSALTASATITAVTLSLYCTAKRNTGSDADSTISWNIYQSTQASATAIANSDYSKFGTTAFSTVISYTNLTTSAFNDWVLNANGITNVNKTGYSMFCLREAYDISVTSPTGYREASFSPPSVSNQEPKLTITYTLPAGGSFLLNLM